MIPGLSYVVPAFNARATLGDTIQSVLAQTLPAIECVIVDDGSTDATSDIARSFADPRVRLVRQRNAGLSEARNTGFHEVCTELVCFLDADDTVEPGHAKAVQRALGSHDLVACAWSFVGPKLEDLAWNFDVLHQDATPQRLLEVNSFPVGCVSHRTASLEARTSDAPLFDPSLPVLEDWDLLLRLTSAGASWANPISEPLFNYRLRPGSMSSDLPLMHKTALSLLEKHALCNETDVARLSRNHRIRSLARAAAHQRRALVNHWSGELECLDTRDLAVLAGALRIEVGRVEGKRPSAVHEQLWRDRAGLLALEATSLETLVSMCIRESVVQAATQRIIEAAPTRRIVIAGMGRNARPLFDALKNGSLLHRVAWIDDALDAKAPSACPRIEFAELRPTDLVIVTPDDPRDLESRARAQGPEVLTLSNVAWP